MTALLLLKGIDRLSWRVLIRLKLTRCRYTRQGSPTPVVPDFSNLASQWATLTPTGVKSGAYAATYTTSAPTCPSSTAGGWTVDPSAALPTIGAGGVSPGMPSGVPIGSITMISSASQNSSTYSSTASSSTKTGSGTTGAAASATHKGAAGRVASGPSSFNNLGLISTMVALIAVGAGVVFWL